MNLHRSSREGAGMVANLLFLLGILVLLQYLSYRHPHEWDLTKNKRFSLAELSLKELSSLRANLELWAFVESSDSETRDLLHQYEIASPRLKVHYVDPRSEPEKAREFGVNSPPPVIVIRYGKQEEQVTEPNEERITNALNRLTKGSARTIYFLQGHDELDFSSPGDFGYSLLRSELLKENFIVKSFSPFKGEDIPMDTSALIVLNPRHGFLPKEKTTFQKYLSHGGRVLFLAGMDTSKEWIDFLKSYGIQIEDDLVVDPAIRVYGAGFGILATVTMLPHPITAPFSGLKPSPILFPLARGITLEKLLPKGMTVTPLVTTSPFGEAIPIKVEEHKITPLSKTPIRKGAIPIACVTAQNSDKEKGGRLVVFGSSLFADNQWFNNQATSNKDLVLNAISWLAESESTIAIHPKSTETPAFLLDQVSIIRLLLLSLIAIPGLGIVLGIATWLRRRHL